MILRREQDEFWRLIETTGTEPDDDDFERLTDLLAARAGTDIVAFEDQLASPLYVLDTPPVRPHRAP